MKRLKFAVIGTGMWGCRHIEHLQKSGRADVIWVVSRTGETVSRVRAQFGIPHGSTDYHDALRDPSVDAVVISSPPNTHAGIALASMRAGKHTVIEKPMTISMEEAEAVASEAERRKELVVIEASCRHARLQPKFDFAKAVVESGRLGEIYYVHHSCLERGTFVEYNPKGTWGMDKRFAGGGPFLDVGVYDLSFHLGLFADRLMIGKVDAFTRSGLRDLSALAPVADVEQHGAAMLEFEGGMRYYYERGSGVHQEASNETRIYGTKGGLRLRFWSWDSKEADLYTIDPSGKPVRETLTIDMKDFCGDDNVPFVGHVLDCLEGKASPAMTPRMAARHLDILFRILKPGN